jgi:hypothetical protein
MRMPTPRNGGQQALAGYLYQIIALLGMRAYAECPQPSPTTQELDALLTLVRDSELQHESFGQDAAIIQNLGVAEGDKCVLVQFKYSQQCPPETIGQQVLLDIVKRLVECATWAQNQSFNVTGFTLITNRELGPSASKLRKAACDNLAHPKLTNNDLRTALARLRIVPGLPLSEWEEALRRFAHEFGTLDNEIERAIDSLVGKLHHETAERGRAWVTEEDLVEAFTGYRQARRITAKSVCEQSRQRLLVFDQAMHPPHSNRLLRQQILSDVARAATERALVVLCGKGGCGKSISLYQWAYELIVSSPYETGPLTEISRASEANRTLVSQTICRWGNLPSTHERCQKESEDTAIERLRAANAGTSRPLFHMALDGLDEGTSSADRQDGIREILRWFWKEDEASRQQGQPPRATLVVTCRNQNDLVDNWLHLDESGYGYRGEPPQSIVVGDFSESELLEAAQSSSPMLYERLLGDLSPVGSIRPLPLEHGFGTAPFRRPSPFSPATDNRVLSAISHPAMWGALLSLPPDVQNAALNGNPTAIDRLVEAFVKRFCTKVIRRGLLMGLNQENLAFVLSSIARYCRDNGQVRQSIAHWHDPSCQTQLVNRYESGGLYNEALSGGLILEDDPNHWHWRHELVLEYLAGQPTQEEGQP